MRKKIEKVILVFAICVSLLAGSASATQCCENTSTDRNIMDEHPIEQFCDGPDGVMLQ